MSFDPRLTSITTTTTSTFVLQQQVQREQKDSKAQDEKELKESDKKDTFFRQASTNQWKYRTSLMQREHFIDYQGKKTVYTLEQLLEKIKPYLKENGNDSDVRYLFGSEANPCRAYDPEFVRTDTCYNIELTEKFNLSMEQLKKFMVQLVKETDGRDLPDFIIERYFFKKIDLKFAGFALFNIAGIELKFAYKIDKEEHSERTLNTFDSWRLYDSGILTANCGYKDGNNLLSHLFQYSLQRYAYIVDSQNNKLKNFVGRFAMLPSSGIDVQFGDFAKSREALIEKILFFYKEFDNSDAAAEKNLEYLTKNFFVHYRENHISAGDDLAELINFLNMLNFLRQMPSNKSQMRNQAMRMLCQAWRKSGVVEQYKWDRWHDHPLGFLQFIEEKPEFINDIFNLLNAAIFITFATGKQTMITAWTHDWMKRTEEAEQVLTSPQNSFSFVTRSGTRSYLQLAIGEKDLYHPGKIVDKLWFSMFRFSKVNTANFEHLDFLFQMFQLDSYYLIDYLKMLEDMSDALKSERVAKSFKEGVVDIKGAILSHEIMLSKYKQVYDQLIFDEGPLKIFDRPTKSYQFSSEDWNMLQKFLESLPKIKDKNERYKTILCLPKIISELSITYPYAAIKFYRMAHQLNLLPANRHELLPKLFLNFVRSNLDVKEKTELNEQIAEIGNECFKNSWTLDGAFSFIDILLGSANFNYLTVVEDKLGEWLTDKNFSSHAGVTLTHRIRQFMKNGNPENNRVYARILIQLLANPKVVEILSKENQIKAIVEEIQNSLTHDKNDFVNHEILCDLLITLLEGSQSKNIVITPFPIPENCPLFLAKKISKIVSLMHQKINWDQQLEPVLKICKKIALRKDALSELGRRALQRLSMHHPKIVFENIYKSIAEILQKYTDFKTLTKKPIYALKALGSSSKLFTDLTTKSLRVLAIQEFTDQAEKEFSEKEWFKSFKEKVNDKVSYDRSLHCKETFKKLTAIKEQQGNIEQLQQYYNDISKTLKYRIVVDDDPVLKEKVINEMVDTIDKIHSVSQKSRTEKLSKIARQLIYRLQEFNFVSPKRQKELFVVNRHQRLQIMISKLATGVLSSETEEEKVIEVLAKIINDIEKLSPYFKENPSKYKAISNSIKELLAQMLTRKSSEKLVATLFRLYSTIDKNDSHLPALFAEAIIQLPSSNGEINKIALHFVNNEGLPFLGLRIKGSSPEKLVELLNNFPKNMNADVQLYLTNSIRRYLHEYRTALTPSQQFLIIEKLFQLINTFPSKETEMSLGDVVAQLINNLREKRLSNDSQKSKPEMIVSFLKVILDRKVFASQWEKTLEETLHYSLTQEIEKLLSEEQIQKICTSLIPKLARHDSLLNGSEKTSKGQELRINLRRLHNVSKKIDSTIAIYSTPQNLNELQQAIKLLKANLGNLSDPVLSSSDVLLAFINYARRNKNEDHLKLIPDFLNFLFKQELINSSRHSYDVLNKMMMMFVSEFPQSVPQLECLVLGLSSIPKTLLPNLSKFLEKSVEIRFDKLLVQLKPSKPVEEKQRKQQGRQNEIILMGAASKPLLKTEVASVVNDMLDLYASYNPNKLNQLLMLLLNWNISNINISTLNKVATLTEKTDVDLLFNTQLLSIRAAFEQKVNKKGCLILLSNAIELIKKNSKEESQQEKMLETLFLEFHQQLIKKFFQLFSCNDSDLYLNEAITTGSAEMTEYMDWIENQSELYQYMDSFVKLTFGIARVLDIQALSSTIDLKDEVTHKALDLPQSAKFANLKQLISQSVPEKINFYNHNCYTIFTTFYEISFNILSLYVYSSHQKSRELKETSVLCKWINDYVFSSSNLKTTLYIHHSQSHLPRCNHFYRSKIAEAFKMIYLKTGNSPKLFKDFSAALNDLLPPNKNNSQEINKFINGLQEIRSTEDASSSKVENKEMTTASATTTTTVATAERSKRQKKRDRQKTNKTN